MYDHVRKELPNISLGTVYRNLTLLSETGHLLRLRVGDGVDHFDLVVLIEAKFRNEAVNLILGDTANVTERLCYYLVEAEENGKLEEKSSASACGIELFALVHFHIQFQ